LLLSCLKNGAIDFKSVKFANETTNNIERYYVKRGDFFYSRGNTKELAALATIASEPSDNIIYPDLLTGVIFDQSKLLPKYAMYLFNCKSGRSYFGVVPEGGHSV